MTNLFYVLESLASIDVSDGLPSESDSYNETMSLLENIDGLSVSGQIFISCTIAQGRGELPANISHNKASNNIS